MFNILKIFKSFRLPKNLEIHHLFFILLAILLLSNLGFGIKEYFENASQSASQSALPTGIPKSQIPNGDEDLYILKSEVVPPVCPACPSVEVCDKNKKCPPCPACARCPEPAFECKKVPTYNPQPQGNEIPRPVLTDFSQFGM